MQKITPFLWFEKDAEAAVTLYTNLFEDSQINSRHYIEGAPGHLDDKLLSVNFTLHGQDFIAFNGGPELKFSPAVSFSVECRDQDEIDRYWKALTEGGEEGKCGWLKDRFGLSWQIVPSTLGQLLNGPDRDGAQRAMDSMLKMNKLDIQQLQTAYRGA